MTETATTETAERVRKEIRQVKFEDFNPEEAVDFLPSWEYKPFGPTVYSRDKPGEFEQEGWSFSRVIDGKEWVLSVYTKRKDLGWAILHLPESENEIKLEGVNKIEFNHQNGQLTFISKGGNYYISNEGTVHSVQSRDKKVYSRIKLPKP